MHQSALAGRSRMPLFLAGVLAANTLIAFALARGQFKLAIPAALIPILLIAFGAFVARNRAILLFAALALPMIDFYREDPILSGSFQIYREDILVALALGSWLAQRLLASGSDQVLGPPQARSSALVHKLRTPLLGWPLLLFSTAVVVAVVRGHEAYGEGYLGNPSRLFLYAAAATTLTGLTPKQVYKGLVVVFYSGTVWVLLTAAYHLARGTSQTDADTLSTGGTRVLALSVSLYLAAALFLALLNLELDESMGRRWLHLAVAGLALLGIILAFGRGTFAAVAIVLPLLVLCFRRIRSAIFGVFPLLLPFFVVAALLIPQVLPDLGPTLSDRISLSVNQPEDDQSLQGRIEASGQIWKQVQESPLIGVGFGKSETFTHAGIRRTVSQNYHNSWLYLLAAGGVALLGAFLLLCAAFVYDVIRRLRQQLEPEERLIVIWSALTLFAFLINALAEPLFGWPRILLTIWILFCLPAVVPLRPREAPAPVLAKTRPTRPALSPSGR